jgi:hypothetical protein
MTPAMVADVGKLVMAVVPCVAVMEVVGREANQAVGRLVHYTGNRICKGAHSAWLNGRISWS